ncbi:unnamed protein product [Miscanthus lutarioriparius]|uniref:Membrane-associated kinase regulator 6 n=1 Tax=Miscanthus lutarioriparius TaxID=422564 RepID=A0A811NS62_9POAL|nr:unnamed protein product [Miscanthus lutarioriparius]
MDQDHTTSYYSLLPEVGSFSYSWPTSKPTPRPEERIVQGDITASSIAVDPASASQCSFDFRLSVSGQTEAMAVADQMFLDGLLLPLHLASQHGQDDGHKQPLLTRSLSLDSSQRMIASAATSRQHPPTRQSVSQNSSPFNLRGGHGTVTTASARGAVFRMSKLGLPSFGRWRKQHRWISFRFLLPFYRKKVRCIWRRKATEEKEKEKDAPQHTGSTKAKLCDLGQESAIRDAILHCKRSL